MNIIGKGILIRAIEEDDLPFLQELMNDPTVEAGTLETHFPASMKGQRQWFSSFDEQKELRCIIENSSDSVPIGYLSITDINMRHQSAVVGVKMKISSAHRTSGDMNEIIKLMTQFCFEELNLRRLEAFVLVDNLLSVRNLERNGFSREGLLKQKYFKHGRWNDAYVYALLRSEVSFQVNR